MEISFQHTNPAASHESTLLHVNRGDGQSTSYLVDAGESVSPAAFLGPDDSLNGVFLTHAHRDHYVSLSRALETDPDCELYTSPATAKLLDQVYTEADRYNNLGDVTPITEALTPIDDWTPIGNDVYVVPVPAGHTPGAVGFLFRIDDPDNNETVKVLATGDFTQEPVGGYPGLTIPESIDVDVLIANAATTSEFEDNLTEAITTLLERALGGATTLVATGGLTGVHLAYLLGHLLTRLDRQVPIHIVGQGAKLYTALEYDVPFVTARPQFEHTDEVLGSGAITIAGPEAPTQGSTARLYSVVEGDPDAVFVQLTTSSPEAVDSTACATHYIELSNHPTEEQLVETVEAILPRHLILKHVRVDRAKELGNHFDNLFYWGNDDTRTHVLYEDGDWPAPPWIDDNMIGLIRRRNYHQSGSRIPIDRPLDELPIVTLTRDPPALSAEGLDIGTLEAQFETTPEVQQTSNTESVNTDRGVESSPTTTNSTDCDTIETSSIDENLAIDISERLETLETRVDELTETIPTASTLETGLDTLETRLDELESEINTLPDELASADIDSVSGTVLRQGDLVLFRVDPDDLAELDLSLAHQQQVELAITDVLKKESEED